MPNWFIERAKFDVSKSDVFLQTVPVDISKVGCGTGVWGARAREKVNQGSPKFSGLQCLSFRNVARSQGAGADPGD